MTTHAKFYSSKGDMIISVSDSEKHKEHYEINYYEKNLKADGPVITVVANCLHCSLASALDSFLEWQELVEKVHCHSQQKADESINTIEGLLNEVFGKAFKSKLN